jgi:hypothetical protein
MEEEEEVEEERQGSLRGDFLPPGPPDARKSTAVQNIFEHWKTVMNHPQAQLDSKRRTLIAKALKLGYTPAQLCEAIEGCSITPHNLGHNDKGQRYDGLHIIFGSSDQIDRFIHNAKSPPRLLSAADRHTQSNVQTLQGWMQKKMRAQSL